MVPTPETSAPRRLPLLPKDSSLHTPDGSCALIRSRDTRCAPLWLRAVSLGLPRGWERSVQCIDPRLHSDVLVHPASSSSWTFALISSTVYLPGMSSGREISILIRVVWTRCIRRTFVFSCEAPFTDRTTFNLFYETSLSSSVQLGTFGTIVWKAFYCRVWVKGGILLC